MSIAMSAKCQKRACDRVRNPWGPQADCRLRKAERPTSWNATAASASCRNLTQHMANSFVRGTLTYAASKTLD